MSYSRTDARQLHRAVTNAGAQLPDPLANLLKAANDLHAAGSAPTADPLHDLADLAAAGKATTSKLHAAVSQASNQAAEAAHAQHAQHNADRTIMKRFRRELLDGGADEILDALRPIFDQHIAGVRAIAEQINTATTPEQFLAVATPDTLALWQSIPTHVAALDAIAAVTDLFTHTSEARVLNPGGGVGPHAVTELAGLDGVALFCVSDSLDPERVKPIRRANGPHLRSMWFRLHGAAQLRTVAEAQERLRAWCEAAFDAGQRMRATYSSVNGELVEDAKQPNPFRVSESV